MRPTARVTLIALLLELLVPAAGAVAAAFAHPHLGAVAQTPPALPPATLPLSFAGFAAAMTLGVWMSDGWEVSASTSEEMRDDAGASGRGGIVGLVVTIAILAACMFAYLHLGTVQGFAANQSDAMAYVAHLLGGAGWRIAIIGVVLISSLSSLWTTILYLSRSVYAMGRDGLLPRGLGRLDVRNEPPVALGVVAVLTTIAQLLTGLSASANAQLQFVLNAGSVFLRLLFVGSALACVRRFAAERASRLLGVVVPALGGFALLGVIGVTILRRIGCSRRMPSAAYCRVSPSRSCAEGAAGARPGFPNNRRQRRRRTAKRGARCRDLLDFPTAEGFSLNDKEIVLTAEGLTKVHEELDELISIHRREVNDRIRQAKEYGDLSENAEYEAAKQEQAFVEGRILKLESMVRNVRIINEAEYAADEVHLGCNVKVKDIKNGDRREFSIVGSTEADPVKGRISNESPLGRAVLGHKKGAVVDVATPRGMVQYRIEQIKSGSAATKRTAKKAS